MMLRRCYHAATNVRIVPWSLLVHVLFVIVLVRGEKQDLLSNLPSNRDILGAIPEDPFEDAVSEHTAKVQKMTQQNVISLPDEGNKVPCDGSPTMLSTMPHVKST